MIRPAALILVAILALYGPTLDHFFVSDDFLNLERNGFRTLAEALGLFSTAGIDFYRPIPRLHFGILQGLVADGVLVWNLAGVLLHALTSVLAAFLAESLLGESNRRAARYTGLFFAVHFIHVEPVVWASGVTSVYVTMFLLAALVFFRRARRTGSTRDRVVSVATFAGALLSKETAVAFVPLLLLTTAFWPVPPASGGKALRRPTVAEAIPYAILLGAYLAVVSTIDRGGDASPYRWAIGPHLVKNAAFFVLGGFLPLRYWQIRDLWAVGGGVGAPGQFIGDLLRHPALGLGILGGAAAVAGAFLRGSRDVRGGFLWILAASLPFLLLPGSGERFLYLPSFGACLVLGLGSQGVLRRGSSVPGGRWTVRAVVAALLAVSLWGSLDRQSDWALAARWTRGIVQRWTVFRELDPDRPIEFSGIPDAYRSAWVFRNGFDSMVRLYWAGRPYAREGELHRGSVTPARMAVVLHPGGSVGMLSLRSAPRP